MSRVTITKELRESFITGKPVERFRPADVDTNRTENRE